MNIQGFGSIAQAYTAGASTPVKSSQDSSDSRPAALVVGTSVSISNEAAVRARFDGIVSKPATQRTEADTAFLQKNDNKFADILAKDVDKRTADDIDYMQKTGGLVNTMANLSPGEKKLYDELVAKGDTEAVRGMNLVALSRVGGGNVTLPNGAVFDPAKTELTAKNVRDLFSQMFVGTDGQDQRSFDALASYLDGAGRKA